LGERRRALSKASHQFELAGAELLIVCTNTMHQVAAAIQERIAIPLLHIADPTAEAITHANMRTVGLLGTRFAMEQDLYEVYPPGMIWENSHPHSSPASCPSTSRSLHQDRQSAAHYHPLFSLQDRWGQGFGSEMVTKPM
jgi:hypothetical protein